jgi:excisionase family DNA binding protein
VDERANESAHERFESDDVYISTGEAARMLRVSPKTVARWAKSGRLPHIVTLGGHRRFPRGSIDEIARMLTVV